MDKNDDPDSDNTYDNDAEENEISDNELLSTDLQGPGTINMSLDTIKLKSSSPLRQSTRLKQRQFKLEEEVLRFPLTCKTCGTEFTKKIYRQYFEIDGKIARSCHSCYQRSNRRNLEARERTHQNLESEILVSFRLEPEYHCGFYGWELLKLMRAWGVPRFTPFSMIRARQLLLARATEILSRPPSLRNETLLRQPPGAFLSVA